MILGTNTAFKGPDWQSQSASPDRYLLGYGHGTCTSQPQNDPAPNGKRKYVLCEDPQSSIPGHLRLRTDSA